MNLPREVNTCDKTLDDHIKNWFQWNKNGADNEEVVKLLKENDIKHLQKLFNKRMTFGTAGLRGRMGPGFAQINDLVIIQTGQGLLTYIKQKYDDYKSRGIVIGFDGRYHSRRFAELTAAIFQQAGVYVNLFPRVCPTPFVAFAVRQCNHIAGVMITASHNPKEDNGYKVYWENGAQINSPLDKAVQNCILDSLQPQLNLDTTQSVWTPKPDDPLPQVMQDYYQRIKSSVFNLKLNMSSHLKVTYTAMHGVGYPYIQEAFKAASLPPVYPVEEQVEPDPEFPTVKFPNPEEGKSALDLAIRTANINGSQIILANDPDADRLAVAEKSVNGEWKVFTGNELGALLGWWCLYAFKVSHPDTSMDSVYMLASTVSSQILKTISKQEHFQYEDTLTGFKWLGNRSHDLCSQGKTVLFAFEEAIGFMCGTNVFDKDGVSAAVKVVELAIYLQSEGCTLTEKLQDLYTLYGYHISDNSYFICHEPETIASIFGNLRNFAGSCNTYPLSILNGKYCIVSVRDLTTGYDSSKPDNKAQLPASKRNQMITFTFDNGLIVTLRTSGTEPKIKYYAELCAEPDGKNLEQLKETLKEMVDAIVEEFLQPKTHNLICRSA